MSLKNVIISSSENYPFRKIVLGWSNPGWSKRIIWCIWNRSKWGIKYWFNVWKFRILRDPKFTSNAEILNCRPILNKEYVSRTRVYFWAVFIFCDRRTIFRPAGWVSNFPEGICSLELLWFFPPQFRHLALFGKHRSFRWSVSRGFPATDREVHSQSVQLKWSSKKWIVSCKKQK
jgi:hypothetical protein